MPLARIVFAFDMFRLSSSRLRTVLGVSRDDSIDVSQISDNYIGNVSTEVDD